MIVTASVLALATLVVANLVRARRRRRADAARALPARRVEPQPSTQPPAEALRGAFGVGLGDVVLLGTGEEAWLSGVLVFDEGMQTLALFVGPDSGGSRYVLAERVGSEGEPSLSWLAEAPQLEAAEGVHVIEHLGERLTRERRRPLAARRTGSLAPDLGDSVVVFEYRGELGGVAWVLRGERSSIMLVGRRLHPGTFDILPGSAGSAPDG